MRYYKTIFGKSSTFLKLLLNSRINENQKSVFFTTSLSVDYLIVQQSTQITILKSISQSSKTFINMDIYLYVPYECPLKPWAHLPVLPATGVYGGDTGII